MNEEKKYDAKIVIFGNWMNKASDGSLKPTAEGMLIHDWLSGKSIDELGLWSDIPMFEKLLREEIAVEKRYRDILIAEISLLRNELLDQANALIAELSKPTSMIVEAYNNGVMMGRHWRQIEIAQRLSDIIDKLALDKITENPNG